MTDAQLYAALGTFAGLLATAIGVFWKWISNLIDRLQNERKASDDRFLEATAKAQAGFSEVADKFTITLERIEAKREITDGRVLEAITAIYTIMAERGVPARGSTPLVGISRPAGGPS